MPAITKTNVYGEELGDGGGVGAGGVVPHLNYVCMSEGWEGKGLF